MLTLAAYVTLFALLLTAAVKDIRARRIPNGLVAAVASLWLVWRIALVASAAMGDADALLVIADSLERAAAALVIGGGLLGLTLLYERITGRYAFGGGDIKLVAVVALFLGVMPSLVALTVACAVSLLYAVLARSTTASNGIPFAPCVACGLPLAVMLVA